MHYIGGPGWHISADTYGAMVLALFLRDAAGLHGAGDPAVSPAFPRVHAAADPHQLLARDGGVEALRTQWEFWWHQLATGHRNAVTAPGPDFYAFAGSPALRRFCQAHYGAALTWSRERETEYERLQAQRAALGEPKILRDLVEDRELELGRKAHNFSLRLIELPLSEPRAWFVEPDRMVMSQNLLADGEQTRSFVQPVVEMLV